MNKGGQSFHVSINGQNYGPYLGSDLDEWAKSGQIDPSACVWHEEQWLPIAEFIALTSPQPNQSFQPLAPIPDNTSDPNVSPKVNSLGSVTRTCKMTMRPTAMAILFLALLYITSFVLEHVERAPGMSGRVVNSSGRNIPNAHIIYSYLPKDFGSTYQSWNEPLDIATSDVDGRYSIPSHWYIRTPVSFLTPLRPIHARSGSRGTRISIWHLSSNRTDRAMYLCIRCVYSPAYHSSMEPKLENTLGDTLILDFTLNNSSNDSSAWYKSCKFVSMQIATFRMRVIGGGSRIPNTPVLPRLKNDLVVDATSLVSSFPDAIPPNDVPSFSRWIDSYRRELSMMESKGGVAQ